MVINARSKSGRKANSRDTKKVRLICVLNISDLTSCNLLTSHTFLFFHSSKSVKKAQQTKDPPSKKYNRQKARGTHCCWINLSQKCMKSVIFKQNLPQWLLCHTIWADFLSPWSLNSDLPCPSPLSHTWPEPMSSVLLVPSAERKIISCFS